MYFFKSLIVAFLLSLFLLDTSLIAFGNFFSSDKPALVKIESKEERFEVGDVSDVYLQGREFEYYDSLHIEFYPEDLDRNGHIELKGFLDSNYDEIDVKDISVEITTNGGNTWSKANGHGEWDWSFKPEIGKTYDFALRVVKNQDNPFVIPNEITIGDFIVVLNEGTTFENDKLSGSGSITLPYLETSLKVIFTNLTITSDGVVSDGTINYSDDFTIETDLVDINIYNLVFSPTGNSSIDASIEFNGELASLGRLTLDRNSQLLPNSLNLNFPFDGRTINIWEEQDVELAISSGNVNITYALGDRVPNVNFNIPSAQFNLGNLLRYADNNGAIGIMLGDISGREINIGIPRVATLLDTGLTLPANLNLNLNLLDLNNPSFTFNSPVNLSNYENPFMRQLRNANIEASISNTGLRATVTTAGGFDPITVINRGGGDRDVKLVFEGDSPSFTIEVSNNLDVAPSFDLNGIQARIYFGDMLNESIGGLSNISVEIPNLNNPSIDIPSDLYLFDSKMRLPDGFNATLNLDDITSPIISFSTDIDFSGYNDNIIVQHITEASINATLSGDSFNAVVTTSKPNPINIYEPKDVRLIFQGDRGPSFGLQLSGVGSLPSINLSGINADIDFGTLLRDSVDNTYNIIASVGMVMEGGADSIRLNLPPKVRLLDSNFALEGMNVDFNLADKQISFRASADLNGYREDPILRSFDGSSVEMEVTPRSVSGAIAVNGDLDNSATILDLGDNTQDVRLTMLGKPTIDFSVSRGDLAFDINGLNASIYFGDLLKDSSNLPISAALRQVNGAYNLELPNTLKLMGTGFNLNDAVANFDVDSKSISFRSIVDLKNYNNIFAEAFDGANFDATLSFDGEFLANLRKDGGLEPITILNRGEKADNILLSFSETPDVSIGISNGGLDFSLSGGSAELAFGEFFNGAVARLEPLEDAKPEIPACQYNWELNGERSIISNSQAKIKSLSGSLDICNIEDPIISFTGSVDLSKYGGLLATIKGVDLESATLSKRGLQAALRPELGDINIYEAKGVRLEFLRDPLIELSLEGSNLDFKFSQLQAALHFGALLDNAIANIEEIRDGEFAGGYNWYIDGKKKFAGSKITLENLSGFLNLDDFTNPSITLNALADLRTYNPTIFRNIRFAGLENATISKLGFDGQLTIGLDELPIWQDKNVYLDFDPMSPPQFNLSLTNEGINLGISRLNANLHFGDLLDGNIVADINSLGDNTFAWSISGKPRLSGTDLSFKNLRGIVNLSDLRSPIISLDAKVNLSAYGGIFGPMRSLILEDATISSRGFYGDISTTMDDIMIWEAQRVELGFINGTSPTLSLAMTRNDFNIGLSNINAKLKFGNLLNGERLTLISTDNTCEYRWSLDDIENPREFYREDADNVISITELNGLMNFCDMTDPVVFFDTTADFTNYNNFDYGINLGILSVSNAKIDKRGLDWGDLAFENASVEFTVLELGNGENDDVRGRVIASGDSNIGVGEAAGFLYFGKLFDNDGGVERSIELTYLRGDDGSKTYGFAFGPDQTFSYSDESGENSIIFTGLQGELIQNGESYSISITGGTTTLRADALSAMNIDRVTATGLTIDNAGFRGTLETNWRAGNEIDILNGSVTVDINSLALNINSSNHSTPISLDSFDAELDFKAFFDQRTLASMNYEDANFKWRFPEGTTLTKGNFEFKGLNGLFDFNSELENISIGLNGDFGYQGLDNFNMNLDGLTISMDGLTGTVSTSTDFSIPDTRLTFTDFSFTFANPFNTSSGSINANFNYTDFLKDGSNLNLNLLGVIDHEGIDTFSIRGAIPSVRIPNFATLTMTNVTISPTFPNFSLSLDGSIAPSHDLFKDFSLSFHDLNIDGDEISIGGAGASVDVDVNAELSGFGMHISRAGLGFRDNKFYLNAFGGLTLHVISADANLFLYSDGNIGLDEIATRIDISGLSASLGLTWYEGHEVYGNGFEADASLRMIDKFNLEGSFLIGSTLGDQKYTYWKAEANAGIPGGIPFGVLAVYEIGGGFAYNMSMNYSTLKYTPQKGSYALILKTNLGTSDSGYMWNGDIRMDAQVSDGGLSQLVLDGDSWLLSNRGDNPGDRMIETRMTYTPNSLHLSANANIKYYGFRINGGLDAKFSRADTHLFIGTDDDFAYAFSSSVRLGHVSVGVFGINTEGFFMVNSNAIAMGSYLVVDKHYSADWWGPDPSLDIDLTAGAKALVIYNPFSMVVDMGLEANLRACYGGCLNIGADVNVRAGINAPPSGADFVWAKARVRVYGASFGWSGYVYNPDDISSLPEASKEPEVKVFESITPANEAENVSTIPEIKVYTPFLEGQRITLRLNNPQLRKNGGSTVPLEVRRLSSVDRDEFKQGYYIIPRNELDTNTTYRFRGDLVATYGDDTKTERVNVRFKTGDGSFKLEDVITSVSPKNNQENIHEDRGVKVQYSSRVLSRVNPEDSDISKYKIFVSDSDKNPIRGTFTPPNLDNRYVSTFQPARSLRVYRYCMHEDGRLKETYVDETGNFLNPFIGYIRDRGDNIDARARALASEGMIDVNSLTMDNAQVNVGNLGNILAQEEEEDDSGIRISGESVVSVESLADNSLRAQIGLSQIPTAISRGLVELANPTAKGDLVVTARDMGVSYTYYRASEYNIEIKECTDNNHRNCANESLFSSKFKVMYNNVTAENRRKVTDMGRERLEPTVTIGYTADRGQGSLGLNHYPDRVSVSVDSDLRSIGVNTGINVETTVTWEVITGRSTGRDTGSSNTGSLGLNGVAMEADRTPIQSRALDAEIITKVYDKHSRIFHSMVPGYVRNTTAVIRYFQDGEELLELNATILDGDTVSSGEDLSGMLEDSLENIQEQEHIENGGIANPLDQVGGAPWMDRMNPGESMALDSFDASFGANFGSAAGNAAAGMNMGIGR